MPTYVCWTRAGLLSAEQRQSIVQSITKAHHDVALAPKYFVQIIFNELKPGTHFIAGEEADPDHIWVRADIRTGRTQDQRVRLMLRIAEDLSAITDAPRENIWIYISDIPGPSVVEFGQVLPQPGEEDAWFDKLPSDLQHKLRSRA